MHLAKHHLSLIEDQESAEAPAKNPNKYALQLAEKRQSKTKPTMAPEVQ